MPPTLASLFIRAGQEALHVADAGLLTETDVKIAAYATKAGMIIVTKDDDFVTMRRLSSRAPRVVWGRIGNATSRALTMRMQPLMAEILAALAAGEEIIEVR